jgi:voltage-gated potassium channel
VAGVPGITPFGRHLGRTMERAVRSGRIFLYLAGAFALLSVGVALLVMIIDEKDFPTFEDGLWWAVVTLGTVGYGDIVPTGTWGRLVGAVVIVFGVTFISTLTAIVTSLFLSVREEARATADEGERTQLRLEEQARHDDLVARLAALERQIATLSDDLSPR